MIANVLSGRDEAGTCVVVQSVTTTRSVVRLVAKAAERQGFGVSTAGMTIYPGESLLDAVALALEQAAIVVAIVDQAADAVLWFELGIAVAKSRPVLVVLAQDDVVLPPVVAGLRTVGPELDEQTLARAFRQTIQRAARPKESLRRPTGVALGDNVADLKRSLYALPHTAAGGGSERAFFQWFNELLSYADVPFEMSSRLNHAEVPRAFANADFAVSADELSANLGDPLPVELILGQAFRIVPQRAKTFELYLKAAEASMVLVVSMADQQSARIWTIPGGDVLACSAATLLQEMRFATFGEAVLAVRNSAIRKAPVK
jgi:hypothetical protein